MTPTTTAPEPSAAEIIAELKRIYEARKASDPHYGQEQMAADIGMRLGSLNRWFRGHIENPQRGYLILARNYIKENAAWLNGGAKSKRKAK